ncbi:MAG: hypothetical protein WD737_07550 [Gemmatimonadota bacterium]
MPHARFHPLRSAVAVLFLAASPAACVSMDTLAEVLASGGLYGQREVSGEVRRIDTRRQEIELTAGWGRSERLLYDGRTEVVYRRRRYRVRDLERGDLVRVRVEPERRGARYARLIEVEQSVRDRRRDDRRW